MHKNKSIFYIILGLVLMFFILWINDSKVKSINPPIHNKVLKVPVTEAQTTKNRSITIHQSKETKENKEVVSDYFSPDPYINQLIILATLSDCAEYIKHTQKHPGDEHIWQSNLVRLKSKMVQSKLKERFKECLKINTEHPEFNLANKKRFENKLYEIEPKTPMQEVFRNKKYIGDDEQFNQQFIKEIAHADTRILLTVDAYYAMNDYHFHYISKIMDLLHTQQIGYAWETANIAQTIYACNIKGGCDGFSLPLSFQCQRDESVCHLNDFNEYIKITYSPGQQADLAIVVKYIEELFADAKL